jgi:hypothetical protein
MNKGNFCSRIHKCAAAFNRQAGSDDHDDQPSLYRAARLHKIVAHDDRQVKRKRQQNEEHLVSMTMLWSVPRVLVHWNGCVSGFP